MHRSRLCSFIIDCKTDDLTEATRFWSAALGRAVRQGADPANREGVDLAQDKYVGLAMHDDEPIVEVQKVDHESRVHLDIESDDVEAEVLRLEVLGAKRVTAIKTWVVMEAPTGQRFCVVRPQRHGELGPHANTWE